MGTLHPAQPIASRARKQSVAREARDMRERRDQKFGVRSSENLEPSRGYPAWCFALVLDVQAIEVLLCRNGFSAACLVKT